jgi:hypothetical protein
VARFQRVNPAVVSGNPETTADVAAPPEGGTIHGKDHSLAARRTPWRVVYAVRVRGDSPYRIRALEREEGLWDVGLDERYTACFSDKCDELEVREMATTSC